MDAVALAHALERWISLAIALAAGALALLSFLAWRRERARRMGIVTGGYLLFAAFGSLVFLEHAFADLIGARGAEVVEHGASILILLGLGTFFYAMRQE